jgi:hypothetical protein
LPVCKSNNVNQRVRVCARQSKQQENTAISKPHPTSETGSMAVVTKHNSKSVSSSDKAKPAWYVHHLPSTTPCSCPFQRCWPGSRVRRRLTRFWSSLTERGLSGVKEGSSRLDNWLSEPPSITDKIAFHLPGRRTLPHKPTNAGLSNLDITGAPNRDRTPDEPLDMRSISINLKYCDY